MECSAPFVKSMTLAERAAWDAADALGLELVTLNPGLILGPIHGQPSTYRSTSSGQLLTRTIPALPQLGFTPVDARDVATAHRLALELPQPAGRRYILATESLWLADIARILAEEYNQRGYRVPQRPLPSWAIRFGARVNPSLQLALPMLDQPAATSSVRARTELGWQTRDVRSTILDTAES